MLHVVPRRILVHHELRRRELLDVVPHRILVQRELRRRRLHLHRSGVQMKRVASVALAVVLFSSAASAQSAQSDKALAKEAYDRGTQASARGDSKRAAEEFARADVLAPSPVALQAALDAAVDADDPLLGAELLERSKRATPTGALAASVDAAAKKLGGRAGHVKVVCPSGARCTSKIDGTAFEPAKGVWMRVGPHVLDIVVDGSNDTRTVEVRAGEDFEVVPGRAGAAPAGSPASPAGAVALVAPAAAPPRPATADGTRSKALAPIVFFVGVGVTVVLAGGSTFYGLGAKSKHDDFVGAKCDVVASSPCQGLKDDGERSQRLANIGFAATGVAGLATVVIGIFFTDWGGSANGSAKTGGAPVVVPVAGGMAAGYGARF